VIVVLKDLLDNCQEMKAFKTHDDSRWHDVRSTFDENWFVRESFDGTHKRGHKDTRI